MPIVDIAQPDITSPIDTPKGFVMTPGAKDIDHGSDAPQFSSVLGAAFRDGNLIGSYVSAEDRNSPIYQEPGFKAWDTIKGTKYEKNWSSFVDVRNTQAADEKKRQLDKEEDDRRTLEAAPWYQSVPAQIAAGVIDLPTLIPGGAFMRGAAGGISIARTAAVTAGAAGVAATAQEAGLQKIQASRPLSESAVNIGASVLLGGLLGSAGAKLLSKSEWDGALRGMGRELSGEARVPVDGSFATSAGAAAMEPTSKEGNAIAGKMASGVAAATARLNPALRILQSPSAATRDIGTNLFENSVYLKKNLDGIASEPAAETLMKEWNGGLAKAIKATDESYAGYVKGGGEMSRSDFREAVGKAMRRDDASDIPEVDKVAKAWRSQVFDPLKNKAIEAKLLPPDVSVETAASYFTRMWNRNKLIAREGEFKQVTARWVDSQVPKWAEEFDRETMETAGKLQKKAAAANPTPADAPSIINTRGSGTQYHGTSDPNLAPSSTHYSTKNYYGQGFYTTDAVDIAHGYSKRGSDKTLERNLYKVDEGRPLKIYDAEAPIADDVMKAIKPNPADRVGELDDVLAESLESNPKNLRELYDRVRDNGTSAGMSADTVQEIFDAINYNLRQLGYNGLSHAGGLKTKSPAHRVVIYFDPEADVRVTKFGYEPFKNKPPEAPPSKEAAALQTYMTERRIEREARFGDPKEHGIDVANEVFNTLTGKVERGVRPEFMTINARGPMKERTFNIPDHLVEDFLEHDVDLVGRRYTRVMGADVELAGKFGTPDMKDALQKVRDDYARARVGMEDDEVSRMFGLRKGATAEEKLMKLGEAEKADIRDLEALRDLLRGTRQESPIERNYGRIVRGLNHVNYIRSMGEVVLASITDAVRPAMVHGLGQFLQTLPQLAANMKGIKLSVAEARLAGNVAEGVLGHRLATISEIIDPYASRGPVESFLENMTNVGSKWNGIRIWTDAMKSVASVMTQNRILASSTGFEKIRPKEKAYLAYLGVDESMAGRISKQFETHGETVNGVKVANTEEWTDAVAVRTYRAAMNKDVDSIIVQKSVADVPLFASTPTGKALLQFKSFALASHQKVLLRGLQEDQTRFVGGTIAMTAMGMLITYLKALSGNRPETQEKALSNPGWWIGEGLDRSGILSVPMEIANTFEKASGFNPIKSPIRAIDDEGGISQKNQNRSLIGSIAGPSAGLIDDAATAASIPNTLYKGDDITKGQRSAAERLIPFSSYGGLRQMLRYVINPQD